MLAALLLFACATAATLPADPPLAAAPAAAAPAAAAIPGRWHAGCGENDAPIEEVWAEWDGRRLYLLVDELPPGSGPWTVAGPRPGYPPEDPLVTLDGAQVTAGRVSETPEGLRLDLELPTGPASIEIRATRPAPPAGARCP